MSKERNFKRLEKDANDFYQPLMKKFVDFKNAHFIEHDGCLKFDPVVYDFFRDLNDKWKYYATKINQDRNKRIILRTDDFETKVNEHLQQHFKLCWINYGIRTLKHKHQIEPDMDLLDVIYHLCFKPKQRNRELIKQNFICTPLKYRKKELPELSLRN